MYRISTFHAQRFHSVYRLSDNVHHSSLDLFSGGHQYRMTSRNNFKAALQTVRIVHCDTSYSIFADVLLHFDDKLTSIRTLHYKRIINFR